MNALIGIRFWGHPLRRVMAGTWCVLVIAFDFLLAQQFIPFDNPPIDGWATLVLTTETLGPVLAITLFHVFTVLAVLLVPSLASNSLVRVALTVSVMNAVALTIATAVASSGSSAIILGATAIGVVALRGATSVWSQFGPKDSMVSAAGRICGAVLLATAVVASNWLPLITIGAGVAISGVLVSIMLFETADVPARRENLRVARASAGS